MAGTMTMLMARAISSLLRLLTKLLLKIGAAMTKAAILKNGHK
jgi:hypothetical protein